MRFGRSIVAAITWTAGAAVALSGCADADGDDARADAATSTNPNEAGVTAGLRGEAGPGAATAADARAEGRDGASETVDPDARDGLDAATDSSTSGTGNRAEGAGGNAWGTGDGTPSGTGDHGGHEAGDGASGRADGRGRGGGDTGLGGAGGRDAGSIGVSGGSPIGRGGSLGRGGAGGGAGVGTSVGRGGGGGGGAGAADPVVDGGGWDYGDGCTRDLARELSVQQIAVYQSVKIPVMRNGAEVAPQERNSMVTEGRETMFRVFVTVGSTWAPRTLSARLTLIPPDGRSTHHYAKQRIATSSVENDEDTSFQIPVHKTEIAAPLRYSIEVVECAARAGSTVAARFPAAGEQDLGVLVTGGLKIKILPVKVDGLVPDTSSAALDGYAKYMMALYPIAGIALSIGPTITATSPVVWATLLDQLRAQRETDKAPADVYYYGLVKPANTVEAFCAAECVTGLGNVVETMGTGQSGLTRCAAGIGYGDRASWETMAHEIGHNHGRRHAPCTVATTITSVDAEYPYPNGALGSWGYDSRSQTTLDPDLGTDIMGYCERQWVSDYTYRGLAARVAAVNDLAVSSAWIAETPSRWQFLVVDAHGPRWGVPAGRAAIPEGIPEEATVYARTGEPLLTTVVYRTKFGDGQGATIMVPDPHPDWWALQIAGAAPIPFRSAAASVTRAALLSSLPGGT